MHDTEWLCRADIVHTVRIRDAKFVETRRRSIQLIVTSPPDLSETSLRDEKDLFALYDTVFRKCARCLAGTGIFSVIVSDRKLKGSILWKHEWVRTILQLSGMALFFHKILIRTNKTDLYRPGFSHVLGFRFPAGPNCNLKVGRQSQAFLRDIWGPFPRLPGVPRRRNSFPPQAVRLLVEAFSRPGDHILDPFCGTGITQRVGLGLGRKAIGYEIDRGLRWSWGELSAVE